MSTLQKIVTRNMRMELAYNGFIQKDLAAAIGITTASLSAKFSGKTNWNLVDIEKAATLFHTRPECLVASGEWGRRGLNPGPAVHWNRYGLGVALAA